MKCSHCNTKEEMRTQGETWKLNKWKCYSSSMSRCTMLSILEWANTDWDNVYKSKESSMWCRHAVMFVQFESKPNHINYKPPKLVSDYGADVKTPLPSNWILIFFWPDWRLCLGACPGIALCTLMVLQVSFGCWSMYLNRRSFFFPVELYWIYCQLLSSQEKEK